VSTVTAMRTKPAYGAAAFIEESRFPLSDVGGGASVWSDPEDQEQAWKRWIDELLRMRLLQEDWDGEGSIAPHPSLVDRAIRLARNLHALDVPPPDRIVPGPNGTIYFEWFTPQGYWEIEVLSPNDIQARRVLKGSDICLTYQLS